jgi:hypothetical protein
MEYPINHMACIVSFLVCPEVVVVIHERDKTIAGEYETVSRRWLVQRRMIHEKVKKHTEENE